MIFVKIGSMLVTSYLGAQPKSIYVRNFHISHVSNYSQLLIVSLVQNRSSEAQKFLKGGFTLLLY